MIYTNTQPLFLPCTYMMNRLLQCHTVVIMEEAQFHRKGHHARALLATPSGHKHCSLSLHKANRKPLNEIVVASPDSMPKVVSQIEGTYRSAPYFKEVWPQLGHALLKASCYSHLVDIDHHLMRFALDISGGQFVKLVRSTKLVPHRHDSASEWMAELGKQAGCKVYYAGGASIDAYIDPEDFHRRGMDFKAQQYIMPAYENSAGLEGDGWISFIDPLFHLGIERYREIVR